MLLQTLKRKDFVHNFYLKYFDKWSPDPDPESKPELFRNKWFRIHNVVLLVTDPLWIRIRAPRYGNVHSIYNLHSVFWQPVFRIRIRLRSLLSSCKNTKKNLDSFYFVTLFDFLSLKNDVNVLSNQTAVVASRRATSLATHPSTYTHPSNLATRTEQS